MEPIRTTGGEIMARRRALGMPRRELAERVGISQTQVVRYELHGAEPSLRIAQQIAANLGCSLDDLAGTPEAAA